MRTPPHAADGAQEKVELADVLRQHADAYRSAHPLVSVQQRALRAIEACRTEALGGHVAQCDACGQQRYHYHSCRNRHCPKCQSLAKERWLTARRAELLPVPYFHVVFTLPHALNALAQGNPRALYGLLFQAVSETLIEFGENPRWLGGSIAATLVLHTWSQTLGQHLHIHALVGAGALHRDGHWISASRTFLFPVTALSAVFRGKFLAGLKRLLHASALHFAGSTIVLADPVERQQLLSTLYDKPWVVYAKRPFAGPGQVLDYLGRYTHRVAISNHRMVSCEATQVRFRYKDYADDNRHKVMNLAPAEFIRRFLLHVLPCGFMRIRHYGILANRAKQAKLTQARATLECTPPTPNKSAPESPQQFWLRVAGRDITLCSHCHSGPMRVIGPIARQRPPAQAPPKTS